MVKAGRCNRCKGVDAEDLPVACALLEGGPCSACKEWADIQGQIKRLEEEIIKLKEKHHALRTTMNSIHDPFIHKLPPEIASHIFCLCLPTLDFGELYPWPKRREVTGILRLGGVCRKWRQLAWATPNLWEMLYLGIEPATTNSLAKSLPGLIEEWLGRSGVLPLTIFFVNDYSGRPEIEFAITRIIEVMNLHSGRWRNLYLDVGADIPERLSGSMDRNRLFILDLAVNGRRSSTPKFVMESKPFPTYLTLENFPPTSIDIGWDNITHATLHTLSADECIEILRRAPALEHCHVREFMEQSGDNVLETFIHSRLRTLDTSDGARKFLNRINVPSLEQWTHNHERGFLPVTAMVSLVERSSCCLKILNLNDISAGQNDLPILFQAMPSLEHLQMHFRSSTRDRNDAMDDILVRIFRSPPDKSTTPADAARETFLPRLQFMEYIAISTPFPWDQVPQLYRQGHRRSLTLKSSTKESRISDVTAMELLKLVDEGAQFHILDTFTDGDFLENFRRRITGREGSLS